MTKDRCPHLFNLSFVLAVVGAATACGNPVAQEIPKDREFTLATFQGIQVPGVFEQNGEALAEILSGDFLLGGDGTCSGRLSFRITATPDVIHIDYERECSWTRVGIELSFSWSESGVSSGTLLSDQLTVSHPSGVVCVTTPCPTDWTAVYTPTPSQ